MGGRHVTGVPIRYWEGGGDADYVCQRDIESIAVFGLFFKEKCGRFQSKKLRQVFSLKFDYLCRNTRISGKWLKSNRDNGILLIDISRRGNNDFWA